MTRTADPLELSARVLATGVADEPTNRVTQQLAELSTDVALVESFSHLVAIRTDEGIVAVDASNPASGTAVMEALRTWTAAPVTTLVYTHGHIDHVGGSGAVAADAARLGHRRPTVVGHAQVPARFRRYDDTNGYNLAVNARQFGGISRRSGLDIGAGGERFLPADTLWPDVTYDDRLTLSIGGVELVLHHDRGETDDHTWVWLPGQSTLCVGDFVTWVFPNAGNPQKVQRYPLEWARALRQMQAYDAELLVPAHGLPIAGRDGVHRVLDDLASALEGLVRDTVAAMNTGATLDEIVQEVQVDADALTRPWMRPVYDEPEFVVRNIWRLYGGWWDQNPAQLKPAPNAALATELTALVGGVEVWCARAQALADEGNLRLACHLIEFAVQAEPDSVVAHGVRAEIYQARRNAEASLMAKGVYAAAARTSRAIADPGE